MIVNLYRHRGYIWRTAWAEVRTRYAGAGLGVVWNLLQPLAMILIFTVVFTSLITGASITTDAGRDVHYTVYLCAALLPWSAFAECVNRGTHAFVHNATYLRKLPIPEQVFVAQTALSTLINLVIAYGLLIVVALALGHHPTWHWLIVPAPALLLIGLGFGLGLLLGTLNAFIRDVGQVVPIILNVAFWLYPIAYFEHLLPEGFRAAIKWNPAYPFLSAIRDTFVWGRVPPAETWAWMVFWTTLFAVLGYVVLRRLRPELRDVI